MANEKRLVDAVRYRGVLERYANAPHITMQSGLSKCMRMAIDTCIELLDMQRTVDAVEVVHGRWVGHYDGSWIHKRKWLTGYDCSVCGNFINTMTPYCPYCGAKMDGDGNV